MSLFVSPVVRAADANNDVLSGAKWYFYESGTTTPASVYTTSARTVAHANPVVADSGGLFAPIYLDPGVAYRAVLKTAAGASIQDIDPIENLDAGSVGFTQAGEGAVARSIESKLREDVSVLDYIPTALHDGIADNTNSTSLTTYIQAAIDANPNKRIVFPAGYYLIESAINITEAPVTLDFSHRQAAILMGTQNMNGIVIGDGTEATKNVTINTHILGAVFNVKAGVAASTSGAAIFRNYAAFCHAEDILIYGATSGSAKLWDGVYDYMAQDCDTRNAVIQACVNAGIHTKGDGTTPGRTTSCNYDNARLIDCLYGIFVDEGCAGLGFYRPTIYSIKAGGWGIKINCTPGPNGQNFFIDTPDVEATADTAGAIYLQSAQKTIIDGGWIGASMGLGVWIGTATDSCDISCTFNQSRLLIEGTNNVISSGDISGDTTTVTDGVVIKGNYNAIASGVQIRQWNGNGIAWGGTTPDGVVIGDVLFRSNAVDIAAMSAFTPSDSPVIAQPNTDKARLGYAAAATLSVPISVSFAQVTGATAIQTIPVRGCGGRLTIQAGTGGLTVNNSGNIILDSSPLSIPASKTASFFCDGSNYYLDGKSF